jgi:raffinose/stachyose/melibiose transport system substrate-binding protein
MLTLISFMLIAAFALVACTTATPATVEQATAVPVVQNTAAPAATATTAPTVTPKPVTINWWHISTVDAQKAVWQSMADAYTAAHPWVTINITVLENEAFKTKLTTTMQSGSDIPDIFQSWGGGVMNDYATAGLLHDITPDLNADNNAWRNTFAPGALGVYAFKGENYGVPWDMGMIGFFYNKTLFAKAGITSTPTTWTELLDDVKALKAAGITPIALGEGDKWPGMHMWAYLVTRIGGQTNFQNAYLRTGSFIDPPFVQAGEKLQDLIALKPFQTGFLGATYGDEATAMGNGKAAMELMGQWAPATEMDNSVDKKGIGDALDWFPFPMVEGGAGDPNDAVGGGNGFAIGKNASPEAIDFVKFLTSAKNLSVCAAAGWCLPPVVGTSSAITDPLLKKIVDQLAKAKYFQLYYDQALPAAMGSVVNDATQGIFAGTKTPQQAAQMLEDSAKQEFK